MKKIINAWRLGVECLLFDDLISYYVFFTVAFTQCCYLFSFKEYDVAYKLTWVLIGYVVLILGMAWFKYNTFKLDRAVPILGSIIFIALSYVGCTISLKTFAFMLLILISSTIVSIELRDVQTCGVMIFRKDKYNKIIEYTLLFITVGIPFILFTVFLCMIPSLPIAYKIVVPIVYLSLAPFISYIEDSWACNNIFELFIE